MPLYEYQCDACGNRFERIQKYSDALVSVCPSCGEPVRKLISSPAIQFKGSGFYITDYAKTGSSESEKADKAASADAKTPANDQPAKLDKGASAPAAPAAAPSSSGDSGTGGASTPASSKDSPKDSSSTPVKK